MSFDGVYWSTVALRAVAEGRRERGDAAGALTADTDVLQGDCRAMILVDYLKLLGRKPVTCGDVCASGAFRITLLVSQNPGPKL